MKKEAWEVITNYMNSEIREGVHFDIAPCTDEEFLKEYVRRDPEFADLLESEFSINVEELEAKHKKYFLLKGTRENVAKKKLKNFEPGDAIWGECAEPIALKEFNGLDEALEELRKYKCSIDKHIDSYNIIEYAIEIQEIDEDGDMIYSDFELAEREEREMTNAEMKERLIECEGMTFAALDENLKKCIVKNLVATDARTGCKPVESGECIGDIFDTLYSLTKCHYDTDTDEIEVTDDAVLYDSIEGI